MKRTVLALAFLLVTSSVASAQFAPSTENLRGLKGVRLMVMFNRADGLDEAQRPEVLKMLEDDVTEKLQKAGVPLFRTADEVTNTGFPYLVVLVTLDKPNGYLDPIVTEVKLFQRVRLLRDSSIETDAVTWSLNGVAGPKVDVAKLRRQVASEIDRFVADYSSVNPKLMVTSNNVKLKDEKK
jgi:hypothetical protein